MVRRTRRPGFHPIGPRRAWSHFRKSKRSAWCDENPADSSEYRHLKSVRRRTSCAESTARTPPFAGLARRVGITVGLGAAPPVVPSSVISSPVVNRWWHEPAAPCRGHAICSCSGRLGPSFHRARAGRRPARGLPKPHSGLFSLLGVPGLRGAPHPCCSSQAPRPEREPLLAMRRQEASRSGRTRLVCEARRLQARGQRSGEALTRSWCSNAARLRELALLRLPRAASSDRPPVAHSTGLPGRRHRTGGRVTAILRG